MITQPLQSLNTCPTLVELVGLKAPLLERSLAPMLNHPATHWRHPAFSTWSEDGKAVHGTAVRTENCRYVEFGDSAIYGAMLVDMHRDPNVQHNLAYGSKHKGYAWNSPPLIARYGKHA